ncbi:hypothetical protein J2D73_16680 [Acetobacter sacchari]|uniref:Uncharacterized protein n=1 Tax=Acetobacter sacchari TaxID=2661687 RepID=A0ABS3LZV5_9PROT|nr:hypothetical protein [Acetobacter sacchari]MBO1361422.1 hypothetical protein [Acetobacter sacchari]
MKITRLFLSAPHNPASGNATPSGIADAIQVPVAPLGAAVVFPGTLAGDTPANVVLVANKGVVPLILTYTDGVSTLPDSVPRIPARRHVIDPFKRAYLADAAGLAVSYWGGPFTVIAGRFHFGVVEETSAPDHPDALETL